MESSRHIYKLHLKQFKNTVYIYNTNLLCLMEFWKWFCLLLKYVWHDISVLLPPFPSFKNPTLLIIAFKKLFLTTYYGQFQIYVKLEYCIKISILFTQLRHINILIVNIWPVLVCLYHHTLSSTPLAYFVLNSRHNFIHK